MSLSCILRKFIDTKYSKLIFLWVLWRMYHEPNNRRFLLTLYFSLLFVWIYAFAGCSTSGNLFVRVSEGILIYSAFSLASVYLTHTLLGLCGLPELIVSGIVAHYSSRMVYL